MLLSEVGEETVTGNFLEAEVEGLMSWRGEGARLMEAVWIVSAIRRAGEDIFGGMLGSGVVDISFGVMVRGIGLCMYIGEF